MNSGLKQSLAGALGGAVLALVVVFGAAKLGYLPTNSAAIHDYLLTHPEILVDMTNKLQADQDAQVENARQTAVTKLGTKAFFDPKFAFITGPANAKITVTEFYDYDCPYCRASLPAMKKFYAAHKNTARFSFIELPIPQLHGPSAVLAARASVAAARQPDKFIAFHFTLMGEDDSVTEDMIYADARKAGLDVEKLKADMADPAVDLAVAAANTLARAAKLDGTPAFVVNGKVREGALNDTTLDKMLKAS